jgi:AcrR family transcriptional regulator
MADAAPTASPLRQRRDEYTRRAILVAAQSLLEAHGPEGLSWRAVAEAVGYSPAALYRYFANKDALLAALRGDGWARLAAYETADPPPDALADRLRAYARRIVRFAAAHPHIYRLMAVDPGAPPLTAEAWRADPATADLLAALSEATLPDGRTPEGVVFEVWLLAHGTAVLRQTLLSADGELAGLAEGAIEGITNYELGIRN